MEYLMTYGWAILIIAVVLGALFALGVFNPVNFEPKAAPGSCEVYRPQGTSTTSFISLEGTCNNELPQYVAEFNGASGFISMAPVTTAVNDIAMSVWIYAKSDPERTYVFYNGRPPGSSNANGYGMAISNGGCNDAGSSIFVVTAESGCNLGGVSLPINTWTMITITADSSSTWRLYINGVLSITTGDDMYANPSNTSASIGSDNTFNGLIANAQFYNTSLTVNEIAALYDEGIGGVPIQLNNLVGWWPLNGNADDYSGNLNNGTATGVVYTSSWASGYSAP